MGKTCTKCKEFKKYEDFSPNKKTSDGLQSWCRSCQNESKKRHNLKHPEKIKESARRWYVNNKERAMAAAKKWNAANKERVKDNFNRWYEAKKKDGAHENKANSDETTAAQGLVLFIPLVDGVFIQDTTAEGGWRFIKCIRC